MVSGSCTNGLPQKDRYRIVVMGGAKVGKSAIVNRFLFERFISEYKATVEEMYTEEYSINDMALTLDFLDTAGSYQFPDMRKLYISTADAFILVYSVDDEASFEEVKQLRQQVIDQKGDELTPIIIVGNKADVEDKQREVQCEMAESTVALDWGNGFMEASAKDDFNITGIFCELLHQINIQGCSSECMVRRRDSAPAVGERLKPLKKSKEGKRNICTAS
jgi:small GTP-binding protein